MADVFLTVSEGPFKVNKLLVVKQLRHELSEDEQFRSMFLDEARLAARLNHPNVVQTYEVGSDANGHFIAMEYIDGQPLHALLRRLKRRLPIGYHVTILTHVLSALDYAHDLRDFDGTELSIVHRDVSPQNVIVTYEGQVKLVDFGVAKSTIAVSETQAGVVKGKAAYMSPEQMTFSQVDRRADVFAVGVMLWEALAEKRLVPPDQEGEAVFLRRVKGEEPRLGEVAPESPPELIEICERAMATDPSTRYATAAEMRVALDRFLDESSLRATTQDLATLMRDHFSKERAAMQQKVTEQLSRTDLEASSIAALSVPRWNASDVASVPQADADSGSARMPAPARTRTPWIVAAASFLVTAVIAVVVVTRGPKPAESRAAAAATTTATSPAITATATPPPPETTALPLAASQPVASTATAPGTPPGRPVAAGGRGGIARPTAAKTPHDRGGVTDLSLEPPKPRRQLDEKDPYAE